MGSIPLPALGVKVANPVEDYKDVMSLQSLANSQQLQKQQIQHGGIENQMGQMQLDDEKALRRAYHDSDGDLDKLQKLAAKYGVSGGGIMKLNQTILAQKKAYSDLDESVAKAQKEKNAQLTPALSSVMDEKPEDRPAKWQQTVYKLAYKGLLSQDEAQQMAQYPGDEQAKLLINAHKTEAQLLEERKAAPSVKKEQTEADQKELGLVGQTLGGATSQAEWDSRMQFLGGKGVDPKTLALIPKQYSPEAAKRAKALGMDINKASSPAMQELQDFVADPPKGYKGTPKDYAKWKASLAPQISFNLGQQAANSVQGPSLDLAAQDYLTTGKLPPGGRGPSGVAMQNKIRTRASEMIPEGMNLAQVRSAYAGDKTAYAALQKQTQAVEAFEATANKNLDQAVMAAKKVTDLGARFANMPIRMLAKAVGTPEQARLVTAVNTARSEIAKVLSSANASGGAVSDSMRHEVEALLDENLPLGSFLAQAQQLKTDMTNRKESYRDQLNDISGKIGQITGGAPGGQAAPASKKRTITLSTGKQITIE